MSAAEHPLASAPWLACAESRRLLEALERDGRPARFVGGCVRDALLGTAAADADLDVATPEVPERVMALLERAGLRALPTGLAHGTVTALIDGRRFEITTLRRDVATDGRHATVAFTDSFEADAARRDFTINAMSADAAGRLFDYFGGRADLVAGRVRFVGAAACRIDEDHLRILRFFRFFARFGRLPPDQEALAACAAAAPTIGRLSGERIQTEMLKLLAAPAPLASLRLMAEAGVEAMVFNGPVALERLERLLRIAPDSEPLLRLAALLRPPPAAGQAAAWVAHRWRLSSLHAERLHAACSLPLVPVTAPAADHRRAIYALGRQRFLDLVRLAAAERPAAAPACLAPALDVARTFEVPRLPVGGDDVLALGLPAGPAVGAVLRAVERWWQEHDFAPDRAACLARLQIEAGASPATPGRDPPRGRG